MAGHRRLWLIALLVAFAAALLPYPQPGKPSAPGASSDTAKAVAPPAPAESVRGGYAGY